MGIFCPRVSVEVVPLALGQHLVDVGHGVLVGHPAGRQPGEQRGAPDAGVVRAWIRVGVPALVAGATLVGHRPDDTPAVVAQDALAVVEQVLVVVAAVGRVGVVVVVVAAAPVEEVAAELRRPVTEILDTGHLAVGHDHPGAHLDLARDVHVGGVAGQVVAVADRVDVPDLAAGAGPVGGGGDPLPARAGEGAGLLGQVAVQVVVPAPARHLAGEEAGLPALAAVGEQVPVHTRVGVRRQPVLVAWDRPPGAVLVAAGRGAGVAGPVRLPGERRLPRALADGTGGVHVVVHVRAVLQLLEQGVTVVGVRVVVEVLDEPTGGVAVELVVHHRAGAARAQVVVAVRGPRGRVAAARAVQRRRVGAAVALVPRAVEEEPGGGAPRRGLRGGLRLLQRRVDGLDRLRLRRELRLVRLGADTAVHLAGGAGADLGLGRVPGLLHPGVDAALAAGDDEAVLFAPLRPALEPAHRVTVACRALHLGQVGGRVVVVDAGLVVLPLEVIHRRGVHQGLPRQAGSVKRVAAPQGRAEHGPHPHVAVEAGVVGGEHLADVADRGPVLAWWQVLGREQLQRLADVLVVAPPHGLEEHALAAVREVVATGDQARRVAEHRRLRHLAAACLLLHRLGAARCRRRGDVHGALGRGDVHRVLGLLDLLGELDRLQRLGERVDDLLVLLGLPVDHLHDRLVRRVEQRVLGRLVLQRLRRLRGCDRAGAGWRHHRLAAAHGGGVHAHRGGIAALRGVALRWLCATGGVAATRLLVTLGGPEAAGPAATIPLGAQAGVGPGVAVAGACLQPAA